MAFEILKQESPRIRGVLFDMDGLVLDTEKLFCRFWMEAARSFGFPMTWDQALCMRSLDSRNSQIVLHGFFGEGADYHCIRSRRIELMNDYIAQNGVDPKPGIRELLCYLHENHIACAITSSSPLERIHRYLGQHDLDTHFDRLCSGHDMPHGKPAPDIYLHGAASLGLPPEACLALEDTPAGIESAFRAGCRPVLIPDLDAPTGETLLRCYAKADSLLDIIDLLESIT